MSATTERLERAGIATLVSKREFGTGIPLVIIVEQAHGVVSCQTNTIRILRRLHLWENVSLIGVEGAASTLDAECLFAPLEKPVGIEVGTADSDGGGSRGGGMNQELVRDPYWRKLLCASLIQELQITGVEYWLVADKPAVVAHGVEDVALYARMFQCIQETFGAGLKWRSNLEELLAVLLKPSIGAVSVVLLEFIREFPRRELNANSLWTAMEAFATYSKRAEIDISKYPAIAGGSSGLILGALAPRTDFVADVLVQSKALRAAILDKIAITQSDRSFVSLYDRLELCSKLISSTCTTADATQAAGESWVASDLVVELRAFLDEEAIKVLVQDPAGFEQACRLGLEFYDLLAARSDAMANNLMELMRERNQDVAVLITGGTHRDGVEAVFAARGVSSLVLQPKMIVSDGDEKAYQELMHDGGVQNSTSDKKKSMAMVAELDKDVVALVTETTAAFGPLKIEGLHHVPHLRKLIEGSGQEYNDYEALQRRLSDSSGTNPASSAGEQLTASPLISPSFIPWQGALILGVWLASHWCWWNAGFLRIPLAVVLAAEILILVWFVRRIIRRRKIRDEASLAGGTEPPLSPALRWGGCERDEKANPHQ